MTVNKEIADIYELLTRFKDNVLKIKNQEVKEAIQAFKSSYENYYGKFIGLKRFSIPVFGKISSGKSTYIKLYFKFTWNIWN